MNKTYRGHKVAVVLPCYNEEVAIADVVRAFGKAVPEAKIFVFDNASTDETAARAKSAGATIIKVPIRGKGNVVRRIFADIEADIYVMADGDGTYEIAATPVLIDALIDERLDMVVGSRKPAGDGQIYRFGRTFGNRLLTGTVARIFGDGFTDMLSGFRVFSRRYVKSFPALSKGFEIETELTIHALELRAPYAEIETAYSARPEGSTSKLSTFKDGARIAKAILRLLIRERPRQVNLLLAFSMGLASLVLGLPIVVEFMQTGLVPRFPTAFLAGFIMLGAMLMAITAVILDSVVTGRSEAKRLTYLSVPGVRAKDQKS
ncbi:MAG: glycosyltransferase [Alphaproteobacteria bacterium]|nr:glycosyltransferase [Alphaproteobacteria bacterium]